MKFSCGVLVIALAINLSYSVPFAREDVPNELETYKNVDRYDFLILSMNYRAGFCKDNPKCVATDGQSHPRWTIHGLWPSVRSGENPFDCPINEVFNISALGPIRARMNESWPSYTDNTPELFWKHEFDKHGTCAIKLRVKDVSNATTFFTKTLDLNGAFNVTDYLKGVTPNDASPIALKNLNATLTKNFGNKVQFHCAGQKNKTDILQEIRLCFDKNLKPTDCPPLKTCATENVWYLKNGASSVTTSIVIMAILAILTFVDRSLW